MYVDLVMFRLWEESESNPRGEKDKSMQSLHNIANTLRNWKNYPARLGAELNEVLENPTIPLGLSPFTFAYLYGIQADCHIP